MGSAIALLWCDFHVRLLLLLLLFFFFFFFFFILFFFILFYFISAPPCLVTCCQCECDVASARSLDSLCCSWPTVHSTLRAQQRRNGLVAAPSSCRMRQQANFARCSLLSSVTFCLATLSLLFACSSLAVRCMQLSSLHLYCTACIAVLSALKLARLTGYSVQHSRNVAPSTRSSSDEGGSMQSIESLTKQPHRAPRDRLGRSTQLAHSLAIQLAAPQPLLLAHSLT